MKKEGVCVTCRFGECCGDDVACSNRDVMWEQSGKDPERYGDSVKEGHAGLIRIEVISDGTTTCQFWKPK